MKLITLFSLLFTAFNPLAAQAAPTKLIWHGHACFEIVTPKGHVLMIDPWLNNPMNPDAANKQDAVQKIAKTDYILVTHGHFDHVADAVALAKKTGARLITNFELGDNMKSVLGYPEKQIGYDGMMNIGGEITLADGEVKVAMVPAVHSSGLDNPKAGEGQPSAVYGGNPAGFVVQVKDGPTFYHTGDTAYFSDMKLIGSMYHPDVALMNIGGHFGMSPKMAARAANEIGAKIAIPHHFKTFEILTQDPTEFTQSLKGPRGMVMAPGQTLIFEGKNVKR